MYPTAIYFLQQFTMKFCEMQPYRTQAVSEKYSQKTMKMDFFRHFQKKREKFVLLTKLYKLIFFTFEYFMSLNDTIK